MNPSNDAVDELYRAYFKAHEPKAWPGPPMLSRSTASSRDTTSRWGSHSALALTAAMLLAAGLWLSDSQRMRPPASNSYTSSQVMREAEANGAKLLQPMITMP